MVDLVWPIKQPVAGTEKKRETLSVVKESGKT